MWDVNRHRETMFNLIRDIYASKAGIYLGFKGGTMAYFFYGLDRFSVDLDFDLLLAQKAGEVRSEIRKILAARGEIREDSDKKNTLFFLFSYGRGQRNVKVEISKRILASLKYKLVNFYGTDVRIMGEEEAMAQKLAACMTRKRLAARDFYDAYFYLDKGTIPSSEVVRELTGKEMKSFYSDLKKFVEKKLEERVVLHGVGDLVEEKKKVWIRKNLKKELLAKLEYRIKNLK